MKFNIKALLKAIEDSYERDDTEEVMEETFNELLGRKVVHVNPNCKDASCCKPHGEIGDVEHE